MINKAKAYPVASQIEIKPNEVWFWMNDSNYAIEELGAVFSKARGKYKLPNTLEVLRDLFRLTQGEEKKMIEEYGKKRKAIREHYLKKKLELPDFPVDERLREYQKQDINFLMNLQHSALFNEQRTGKTPTILCLMKARGDKRIGIVVPASLIYNWVDEVRTWLGKEPIVVNSTKQKRARIIQELKGMDEFVYIISYETLRTEIEKMVTIPLDALVLDEAHKIRNRDTKTTKAVFKMIPIAKHRHPMTGTPSIRAVQDLWSILHFMMPEMFSSYHQFEKRYCELTFDRFKQKYVPTGRCIRPREIEEIISAIGTNRKRKEVMQWLPKKEYMTIRLAMDSKQEKLYKEMEETFEIETEDGEVALSAPNTLAKLIYMRQLCLAPEILGLDAPSAKEKFLFEWLEDNPEPVVIFSTFTKYLLVLKEKLEKEGYRVGIITGKNRNLQERQEYARKFQNGELDIMLCNIEAAGVGLTLDRAEVAIFLDKEWNPPENEQAEDRIIPVSEERNHPVTILSLVIKDTYDEVIDVILSKKQNITDFINSGGFKALQKLKEELKNGKTS